MIINFVIRKGTWTKEALILKVLNGTSVFFVPSTKRIAETMALASVIS